MIVRLNHFSIGGFSNTYLRFVSRNTIDVVNKNMDTYLKNKKIIKNGEKYNVKPTDIFILYFFKENKLSELKFVYFNDINNNNSYISKGIIECSSYETVWGLTTLPP